MLTELRISNFALIDHLHLVFSEGFQVFTGETGAGKSLLVDAFLLLAGGRSSVDLIRAESGEAVLEAAFSLSPNHPVIHKLRELDLLHEGENELVIRRVLSRSGRSRLYVNGTLGSVQIVQEITSQLIDIHSQHDQQSLFSGPAQLAVLDEFAQLQEFKAEFKTHYDTWQAVEREQEETLAATSHQQKREEFLRFQYTELEQANLTVGEDESLTQEHRRLLHAERLGELAERLYDTLYAGEHPLLAGLQQVSQDLHELARIDSTIDPWPSLCEQSVIPLREIADGLRDYRHNIEYDPARLAQVDERLDKLQRLQKKYGGTSQHLIEQIQVLHDELEGMSASQEKMDALAQQIVAAHHTVMQLAEQLSKRRYPAAQTLEKKIMAELGHLGMKHIQFHVKVEPLGENGEVNATGRDRVIFLLSANEGEPLHPLHRIVSGGELSRIMLAIKTVLAEIDHIPVLVFDEVDSGIGGVVASAMGERLRALSRYHQVFCITHLPHIASQANVHVHIEKMAVNNRTVSQARVLDDSDRQEEIARMLGGANVTKAVRSSAAEMLERGRALSCFAESSTSFPSASH